MWSDKYHSDSLRFRRDFISTNYRKSSFCLCLKFLFNFINLSHLNTHNNLVKFFLHVFNELQCSLLTERIFV